MGPLQEGSQARLSWELSWLVATFPAGLSPLLNIACLWLLACCGMTYRWVLRLDRSFCTGDGPGDVTRVIRPGLGVGAAA